MAKTLGQRLATKAANSFLLRKGKEVHENFIDDPNLGGSFVQKLLANVYLIARDYGTGLFPPKLGSREETFEQEREQFREITYLSLDEILSSVMRKPFQLRQTRDYLRSFVHIVDTLESRCVRGGSKLLELGAGSGWLAEMLALQGYSVTGTTIAPIDIDNAQRRREALRAKGLQAELNFICCPMEDVDKHIATGEKFDAVYCFEALHHVYSWRESVEAAKRCLRPGGWLLICSEPPTLHTYVCYRSSKIHKTHEIGFNPGKLSGHLRKIGFADVKVSKPVFIEKLSDFWMYFSPFTVKDGSVLSKAIWVVARNP